MLIKSDVVQNVYKYLLVTQVGRRTGGVSSTCEMELVQDRGASHAHVKASKSAMVWLVHHSAIVSCVTSLFFEEVDVWSVALAERVSLAWFCAQDVPSALSLNDW